MQQLRIIVLWLHRDVLNRIVVGRMLSKARAFETVSKEPMLCDALVDAPHFHLDHLYQVCVSW